MKIVFFFASLCVLLTSFASLCVAQAQNWVPLRTGMHSNYVRLVFGWSEKTNYTVERTEEEGAESLTLSFDKAASLDLENADFEEFPGISGVKELSQNPLVVSIPLPKDSDLRDFRVGKRVVVDVYFSKERLNELKTQSNKPDIKLPPKKEKPAVVLVSETLPESKEERKKEEEKEEETAEKQLETEGIEYSPTVKRAIADKHHVISIRGTQGLSVGSYVEGNSLWLVVIGGSIFSKPTLLSPTPELFSRVETVKNDVFDMYRLGLPEGQTNYYIKAIGGALAWDIIIGDKVRHAKAIEPVRKITSTHNGRGGKIIWPMTLAEDVIETVDPLSGQKLYIITATNATQLSGPMREFVDFKVLPSSAGMAILPKVDDLIVQKTPEGIEISRSEVDLSLGLSKDIEAIQLFKNTAKRRKMTKEQEEYRRTLLFKFDEWQLGEPENLERYEMVMLSAMHGQPESRLVQELLKLGKMFLGHGYAAEALGYFDYASNILPALGASPEFRALRGAAEVLDYKYEDAFSDFLFKDLGENDEVRLWKSMVLAGLEDWKQAASVLPDDYTPVFTYPDNIALRMALTLAEVNLRDGKVETAEDLMDFVREKEMLLTEPRHAALNYLEGEAARQRGEIEETKRLWKELSTGRDDMYRTKAGLALTMLHAQNGTLSNEAVIDNLERLRYSWRGDALEAQVNYWLGEAYFKDNKFIKGLSIMREAAIIAKDTAVIAGRITDDMARTFTNMFMTKELDDVSPLDAYAVYDQFKELTPVDKKGDKLVQRLAEHLVKADLLGKSADLLRYQVDHRLKGKEKLRIAIRLAAIELLDKQPQKSLDVLAKATEAIKHISDKEEIRKRTREITLLKIRAYSQNKQYSKALSLIEKVPMDEMVNRLRADIAWKAGYWDVAAGSLKEVLIDERITPSSKLTPQQVDMILNRAIALNLDGDKITLANMRERYTKQMAAANKDKARQFELITRKARSAALNNREALLSAVSEVDLFQEFLESYRNLHEGE